MNEESTPREGAAQIATLEARIRELEAKLAAAGAAGSSEKQITAAIEERAERLFEDISKNTAAAETSCCAASRRRCGKTPALRSR